MTKTDPSLLSFCSHRSSRPLNYLEVGCYEGLSTCWMLTNILKHPKSKYTVCDTFCGVQELLNIAETTYVTTQTRKRFDYNIATTNTKIPLTLYPEFSCNMYSKLFSGMKNNTLAIPTISDRGSCQQDDDHHKNKNTSSSSNGISGTNGSGGSDTGIRSDGDIDIDIDSGSGVYDIIYIDGSHVACDVLLDAVCSFVLLKVNGILMFDDYQWKLLTEEYNCPGLGIDIFKSCFEHLFTPIHVGYQYHLQKRSHSPFGQTGDERIILINDDDDEKNGTLKMNDFGQLLSTLLPSLSETIKHPEKSMADGAVSTEQQQKAQIPLLSSLGGGKGTSLLSSSSSSSSSWTKNTPVKRILVLGTFDRADVDWLIAHATAINVASMQEPLRSSTFAASTVNAAATVVHTTYVSSGLTSKQRTNVSKAPAGTNSILIGYPHVLLSTLMVQIQQSKRPQQSTSKSPSNGKNSSSSSSSSSSSGVSRLESANSDRRPLWCNDSFDIVCVGNVGGDRSTCLLNLVLSFGLLKVGGIMVAHKHKSSKSKSSSSSSSTTNIQLAMDGLCDCYEPHIRLQPHPKMTILWNVGNTNQEKTKKDHFRNH